ncbi:MAG: potassium transporter Kup [Candidatus Binatus sp.]
MKSAAESAESARATPNGPSERKRSETAGLVALNLAALGVVYGDIGTSPLYAFRQCFFGQAAVAPTLHNVLGVLSLILWALTLAISVKYLSLVMRADNRGDGGIIALVALLNPVLGSGKWGRALLALGLFGAALLYGDGLITPAISVLSAIEGLEIANARLTSYVVPIACVILVILFAIQRHGTGRVGAVFGPFMLVWFSIIAVLGIEPIIHEPRVFLAINPVYAIDFFRANGFRAFRVLGAVFLVVTGGEALYADMGHFGLRPIRLMWFFVVLPALVLNYFGQGALLLHDPGKSINPFYHLAPGWAVYPLVVLAAAATIIASQAVISGAFSLTRQAINLQQLPRMRVLQTSSEEFGQVYVPLINQIFMVGTLLLVIGFGSANRLAGAYGVGVTTTMVITTILVLFVIIRLWRWSYIVGVLICAPLLCMDLSFFGANILKIVHGGWVPLTVGVIGYGLMSTWSRGRALVKQRLEEDVEPLEVFLYHLEQNPATRIPGTAIFLTGRTHGTPPMLLHHVEHNHVLHERVILLNVVIEEIPRIAASERLEFESLGQGIYRTVAHYGFMQTPNIPAALRLGEKLGLKLNLDEATYYLGRETLIPADGDRRMARWRARCFAVMSRNATRATAFFQIPPEQVVEIGIQVKL